MVTSKNKYQLIQFVFLDKKNRYDQVVTTVSAAKII